MKKLMRAGKGLRSKIAMIEKKLKSIESAQEIIQHLQFKDFSQF